MQRVGLSVLTSYFNVSFVHKAKGTTTNRAVLISEWSIFVSLVALGSSYCREGMWGFREVLCLGIAKELCPSSCTNSYQYTVWQQWVLPYSPSVSAPWRRETAFAIAQRSLEGTVCSSQTASQPDAIRGSEPAPSASNVRTWPRLDGGQWVVLPSSLLTLAWISPGGPDGKRCSAPCRCPVVVH